MHRTRLALFFLLAATATVSQAQEQMAIITEIDGEVSISRASGGSAVTARWGIQLFAGDVVQTGSGAKASILFSNSNLLAMGANSQMEISGAQTSSRNVDPTLLADVSELTLHRSGEGELAALGGLRSGASRDEIRPLSPRNTLARATRPEFSWSTSAVFDSYTVSVLGDDGVLWSGPTASTSLIYPENAPTLSPGNTYWWRVEGEDMLDVTSSDLSTFSVLSEAQLEAVVEAETQIDALFADGENRASHDFLLGSFYAKEGLAGNALAAFERIAETHPESTLLYQILGKLYSETGQKDRSIAALQRAIELEQQH
jgi:Tetratricopeptide repeat